MSKLEPKKAAIFSPTTGSCPIGEITGNNNMDQSKIPVLSCEGACKVAMAPIDFKILRLYSQHLCGSPAR